MDKEDNLFIKYPGYKKLYECFIEIAETDAQKEAIEQIMKNGEYNGYKLNSMLSNEAYSDRTERDRRINFCEMILFDNDLFDCLVNNGLNVFHGTKIDALQSILSKGVFSSSELKEKGIQLLTGEERTMNQSFDNNIEKRNFISLTDDFDTAALYAGFSYEEQIEFNIKNFGKSLKKDEDVPIIICFNGTDIKREYGKSLAHVKSTCNEIGVTTSINPSNVKCIITSYDKVEYVKSLASKYGIDVMGYDFNDKFKKRLIDKKGKFYSILNYDIIIDEEEFEKSKEQIKENLKKRNINRSNQNLNNEECIEYKQKVEESKNQENIGQLANNCEHLSEDLSMQLASNVKMDIVFYLTGQYDIGGTFIPITANDLIAKYNINENVAQILALEINTMLEGYIQEKEQQKENFTPYVLDGFEEEIQGISTQRLGKETVNIQEDVNRMDRVERKLNEHIRIQEKTNDSHPEDEQGDDYVM